MNMNSYYLVVEEWNYPTESGRNILDDFDTESDAMDCALKSANFEKQNFVDNCGDARNIEEMIQLYDNEYPGYIITPKNCSDPFFYVTKVIEVNKFK